MAATPISVSDPAESRRAMAREALNLARRGELLAWAADVAGDGTASSLAEEVIEAAWKLRRHLAGEISAGRAARRPPRPR